MENLQRRASGVYVTRLVIPMHLRRIVGKREFVATTGTHHLPVAKLVAVTLLARWRQQLIDLERLARPEANMNHDSLIKIADGHPLLADDSYLPLEQAATVLGLNAADLLRAAANGRFGVYYRFASATGFLLPFADLEPDDGEIGSSIVPERNAMPGNAVACVSSSVLGVPRNSAIAVASSLLVTGQAVVLMFQAAGGDQHLGFIPDTQITLTVNNAEVSTRELERFRRALVSKIEPDRIAAARSQQKMAMEATLPLTNGRNSHRLFSEALDAYTKNFLPQKITSVKEIERVRSGIALFIEFEGDLRLADIDAERLRMFRDEKLSKVLARENQVRLKYKTRSMTESMETVSASGWPVMSADERNQRMQWIGRMLNWLKEQKWITDNPATALKGESVENKAERRQTTLQKTDRQAFTEAELQLIFGAPWFITGKGELSRAGTYREFCPFRFWLPLLGVYVGGRINELCQLRLSDIRMTETGTWYIDINEDTADKSLKRQSDTGVCWSKRKVPVHPALIANGFIAWCERLRQEGYQRLFPELSWNADSHYAKEPIRAMSQFFLSLGLPRDNTKVFHSFRHGFNNAIAKLVCSPEWRKRLMGHEPGSGVNEQHYLADPTPDESIAIVRQLSFSLPTIARFDVDEGVKAVQDALMRKKRGRGVVESLGG